MKKEPHEPYKDILAIPEIVEVSLFKNKNYKVAWSTGLNMSRLRPIVCVLDNKVGPNPITAGVTDTSRQDSFRKRDMPDIRSASDTSVRMSGTKTLHLCIGQSPIRDNVDVLNELFLSMLLGTTYLKVLSS